MTTTLWSAAKYSRTASGVRPALVFVRLDFPGDDDVHCNFLTWTTSFNWKSGASCAKQAPNGAEIQHCLTPVPQVFKQTEAHKVDVTTIAKLSTNTLISSTELAASTTSSRFSH
ncbi:hypothetical protein [Bradyrhizobium australiense]|uniref:Uncharacterized protein n=1 Tax=Bradyrhizobium australiense TaxID=2721161 RepID=A0A7Y4GZQ3_9BRAD|nr:hypothetical protein [Bradyrhizobium australiense]NOJ44632.1 hypothetical protein [Bradyrhizobium australiense]